MAEYEELVELGFEGIDKFACGKYHDKVYDHLPAWKKKQRQQEAQANKKDQNSHAQQDYNRAHGKHDGQHKQAKRDSHQPQHRDRDVAANNRPRSESPAGRSNVNFAQDNMSHAPPYTANFYRDDGRNDYRGDARNDYRDDRAPRYVREESTYYVGPNAGAMVMRDIEADAGRTGYQVSPYVPSPPPGYAGAYDVRRNEPDRGRPATSRMRSMSYSPPRNERYDDTDDDKKSRRRRRSKSRSRSGDRDGSSKERIVATLLGGLMGGFAGKQLGKGQKFDTAATIGGAVLGGIASRELAEKMGEKKGGKRDKRREEQEAWEAQRGGGGGRDDDRRRSRSGDGRDARDSRRY